MWFRLKRIHRRFLVYVGLFSLLCVCLFQLRFGKVLTDEYGTVDSPDIPQPRALLDNPPVPTKVLQTLFAIENVKKLDSVDSIQHQRSKIVQNFVMLKSPQSSKTTEIISRNHQNNQQNDYFNKLNRNSIRSPMTSKNSSRPMDQTVKGQRVNYNYESPIPYRFLRPPMMANGVNDMMSMPKIPFLKDYKNPCWREILPNSRPFPMTNDSRTIVRLRCLPYFHLIGVCKSGTTDLFLRILKHPNIMGNSGSLGKETQWWARGRYGYDPFHDFKPDPFSVYLNYFNYPAYWIDNTTVDRVEYQRAHDRVIIGEGSPTTMWDLSGWRLMASNNASMDEPTYTNAHCIKRLQPDIKLLAIFRNPTERLYSDYLHLYPGNKSATDFHHRVVTELYRFRECRKVHSLRACIFNRTAILNAKVRIYKGFYAEFLKEWWSVFPKERLLIFRTEEYSKNIADHLSRVFKFLDIRPLTAAEMQPISALGRHHVRKINNRVLGPMLPETRKILNKFHQPYNDELAELLKDVGYR